jgi:hypothetical protein
MTTLALSDLHGLTTFNIEALVTSRSPGVYVLDRTSSGGFTTHYAGRADEDVAGRLKDHARNGIYKYFKFDYASNVRQAFEMECRLYHDLNPPDNKVHPAKPKGTYYACPVYGCPL